MMLIMVCVCCIDMLNHFISLYQYISFLNTLYSWYVYIILIYNYYSQNNTLIHLYILQYIQMFSFTHIPITLFLPHLFNNFLLFITKYIYAFPYSLLHSFIHPYFYIKPHCRNPIKYN